jgi:large subunit ribosomal protein L18
MYAQVISANGSHTLVTASTVEKSIKKELKNCGNIVAAEAVGKEIAKRAMDKGIVRVAFDRSGFKYHGRVKSLANSARENGLIF